MPIRYKEGEIRQRRSRPVPDRSSALASTEQVGRASRISSMKGHETASGTVAGAQLNAWSARKRTMVRPRGQTERPDRGIRGELIVPKSSRSRERRR
jgi:hypothetical protein